MHLFVSSTSDLKSFSWRSDSGSFDHSNLSISWCENIILTIVLKRRWYNSDLFEEIKKIKFFWILYLIHFPCIFIVLFVHSHQATRQPHHHAKRKKKSTHPHTHGKYVNGIFSSMCVCDCSLTYPIWAFFIQIRVYSPKENIWNWLIGPLSKLTMRGTILWLLLPACVDMEVID